MVAQKVKNLSAMQRPRFDPWVGKIPWRRERLPTPVFWPGELHWLYNPWDCKELDTTKRLSLHFTSLQGGISDKEAAFQYKRHRRCKRCEYDPCLPLEKGMASQSTILAWRIPWTVRAWQVAKSGTWLKWFSMHMA